MNSLKINVEPSALETAVKHVTLLEAMPEDGFVVQVGHLFAAFDEGAAEYKFGSVRHARRFGSLADAERIASTLANGNGERGEAVPTALGKAFELRELRAVIALLS